MDRARILVVDRDANAQRLVAADLEGEGYSIVRAATGEQAVRMACAHPPDLIILEQTLPDRTGLDVRRTLQQAAKTRDISCLVLNAQWEEIDIVTGLELEVSDHLSKPFNRRALATRVQAVLRRESVKLDNPTVVEVGAITIHRGRREVLVQGHPVEVTATPFRILLLLASQPGWVFTRRQIAQGAPSMAAVSTAARSTRTLSTCAASSTTTIETVRGFGYRLTAMSASAQLDSAYTASGSSVPVTQNGRGPEI
ncbi:MAG: response regulator [Thermoleophilia bacterium]|jgi:two-component system phosphate regulon response regulator PhoB